MRQRLLENLVTGANKRDVQTADLASVRAVRAIGDPVSTYSASREQSGADPNCGRPVFGRCVSLIPNRHRFLLFEGCRDQGRAV